MKDVIEILVALGVACAGGVVGLHTKSKTACCSSVQRKIFRAILYVLISMFTGYVGYEVALHTVASHRLSVAIAGVCGFVGVDLLASVQTKLLDFIEKKRL